MVLRILDAPLSFLQVLEVSAGDFFDVNSSLQLIQIALDREHRRLSVGMPLQSDVQRT